MKLLYIDPLKDRVSKVEIIDYMGDDSRVVDAARVSMDKEAANYTEDQNNKLIHYLAKHKHWTPFSHSQLTLRIKMPIFVARQWFKHQVGFTRNEVSRRYVSDPPEFYHCGYWREKAESVKQGSGDDKIMDNACAITASQAAYDASYNAYQYLLQKGVCPEQARMVLPQGTYTEFIETASLAAYARLCKLRLDPHAQKEVQAYAEAITQLIPPGLSVSWKALMEN